MECLKNIVKIIRDMQGGFQCAVRDDGDSNINISEIYMPGGLFPTSTGDREIA